MSVACGPHARRITNIGVFIAAVSRLPPDGVDTLTAYASAVAAFVDQEKLATILLRQREAEDKLAGRLTGRKRVRLFTEAAADFVNSELTCLGLPMAAVKFGVARARHFANKGPRSLPDWARQVMGSYETISDISRNALSRNEQRIVPT